MKVTLRWGVVVNWRPLGKEESLKLTLDFIAHDVSLVELPKDGHVICFQRTAPDGSDPNSLLLGHTLGRYGDDVPGQDQTLHPFANYSHTEHEPSPKQKNRFEPIVFLRPAEVGFVYLSDELERLKSEIRAWVASFKGVSFSEV